MNLSVNTRLHFPDGEEAGRITRVVFGVGAGEPQSVVVATPGLVRRAVVVPVGWLHEDVRGVRVDLDPDTFDALDETSEIRDQKSDFSGGPIFMTPGDFSDGGAPGVMSYF